VDHTPSELLLLSGDKLELGCAAGLGGGSGSLYWASLAALQVDDQSPGSLFPVALWHAQAVGGATQPLLSFRASSVEAAGAGAEEEEEAAAAADAGAAKLYPSVVLAVTPAPLHIRVHEPLIWRVLAFSERLRAHGGGAAAAPAAAGAGAVVAADPLVCIGELSVSGAALRITFKGEPESRPLHGLGGRLMAFANLDGAPVAIQPPKWPEGQTLRRSAVAPELGRGVSRQVALQSLRLLTGVDLLADASDTLATLSGGIASITGDAHFQERSGQRRRVEETSMAGALVHGGEALGAGLFRGLTGMVTKPVEGARSSGLSGFIGGVGRGVAGLVLQPVSGAVDLASKAVEGVNASKSSVVDLVRESGGGTRRRPPLAIDSHGAVRRFDRKAAEGQLILRLAEWRAVGSAGGVVDRLDLFKTRSKFAADAYEWHELLPDGRIAMVTDARAMLLEKPSAQADLAAERCSITWVLPFTDMLSVEGADMAPARAPGKPPLPSTVVMRLRSRVKDRLLSASVDSRVFACAPGTEQAAHLLAAVQAGLDALASASGPQLR